MNAPWKSKRKGRMHPKWDVTTSDGSHICSVGGCKNIEDELEKYADLITAAPELLEALEEIRRHGLIEEKDGYGYVLKKMNEAIKKARQ